jgi:nitrate/nitrite-specific signal transduction histidine kinase
VNESKPKNRRSIKTKIITWSFVPTIIILISVALVTFYSYQKVTEDLVFSQSNEVANYMSDKSRQVFAEIYNPVLLDFIFNLDYDKSLPLLERAEKLKINPLLLYVFDGGMVVLDEEGKVTYTVPEMPELIGEDWSDRDYFAGARIGNGATAATGRIREDGPLYPVVLPISLGMFDENNQFIGVIVFFSAIKPDGNTPLYLAMKAKFKDENVIIMDAGHRALYHYDPAYVGRNLSDQDYLAPIINFKPDANKENHPASYRSPDGSTVISTSVEPLLLNNYWMVVKEQAWKDLMAPSLSYRRLLLILLAAGVLIPIAVVTYGVRHLTQPIDQMINAAREIADGRFGQKIDANSGDELEDLAVQFNKMSTQLAQSYATLEQRVEDRTRELATINEITKVVSRTLNIEEVLQRALEKTVEITNMDAGNAYRLNPDSKMMVLLAHTGFSEEYVNKYRYLPLDMTNYQADGKMPEVFVNYVDAHSIPAIRESLKKEGVHVIVRLLLWFKNRPVGFIGLAKRTPELLTENEIDVFKTIGRQISVAIENSILYEQAEETAALAERNRLARELHDAVSQTLFSASLIAEVLPQLYEFNPEEGQKRTKELRRLARGALAEMRTLLMELRPAALTQVSLAELLKQLCEAAVGRSQLPIKLSIEGDREYPPDVQVALYRITQEALNNVIKYAHAKEVRLELLQTDSFVEIAVRDDGIGFDRTSVPANHFGLKIMQERAEAIGAELQIVSTPGAGSHITVTWCDNPDCLEDEEDE